MHFVIQYPDTVSSSLRDIVAPDEDPAYYQHQKEDYIDEFYIHKTESVDLVKEQIDCVSPCIQSRLQVVSNVDEEDRVELTYPEKEGEECVHPDSESKVRIYP